MPADPDRAEKYAAMTLAIVRARAEAAFAARDDYEDILNNPLAVFTAGYSKRGSKCS